MELFHKHKWQEVSRSLTPGLVATKGHPFEYEYLLKLAAGQTHIYLKCESCGDVTSRTLPGQWKGGNQ